MKFLHISRNSWHYRIAELGGFNAYKNNTYNICEYTQSILKTCFFGLIGGIAGMVGIYLLIHMILGLVISILYGIWIMDLAGFIALDLLIVIGITAAVIYIPEHLPTSDNFIKHAYNSWKEKYCAKIDFVE